MRDWVLSWASMMNTSLGLVLGGFVYPVIDRENATPDSIFPTGKLRAIVVSLLRVPQVKVALMLLIPAQTTGF